MSRPPEPETRVEEALGDPAALGAALASLGPALELLERFHHRNKNQHRMSKWWAQADMLRRHVRKLLGELERAREEAERSERRRRQQQQRQRQRSAMAKAAEVKVEVKVEVEEKAETEREREGKKDEAVLPLAGGMMVAKRAEYLRARLGPGAFLAFTQLAADRQFAHLGLMLLGVLAQVDRAAAPFAPDARETSAAQQQQEAAMTTATMTATGARSGGSGGAVAVAVTVETHRDGNAQTDTAMDVDVGVAVSREEVMASIERDAGPRTSTSTPTPRITSGSDHTDPAGKAHPRSASLPINTLPTHRISHSSETPTAKTEPASKESSTNPEPAAIKPKKKKAGKGDEFDDIFGGLDSNSKKPKKKKRKRGDEFDDIFSGL